MSGDRLIDNPGELVKVIGIALLGSAILWALMSGSFNPSLNTLVDWGVQILEWMNQVMD